MNFVGQTNYDDYTRVNCERKNTGDHKFTLTSVWSCGGVSTILPIRLTGPNMVLNTLSKGYYYILKIRIDENIVQTVYYISDKKVTKNFVKSMVKKNFNIVDEPGVFRDINTIFMVEWGTCNIGEGDVITCYKKKNSNYFSSILIVLIGILLLGVVGTTVMTWKTIDHINSQISAVEVKE